jgi:hypothetical protein
MEGGGGHQNPDRIHLPSHAAEGDRLHCVRAPGCRSPPPPSHTLSGALRNCVPDDCSVALHLSRSRARFVSSTDVASSTAMNASGMGGLNVGRGAGAPPPAAPGKDKFVRDRTGRIMDNKDVLSSLLAYDEAPQRAGLGSTGRSAPEEVCARRGEGVDTQRRAPHRALGAAHYL